MIVEPEEILVNPFPKFQLAPLIFVPFGFEIFTKPTGSPTHRLVEKLKSASGDGTNVIVNERFEGQLIPVTLALFNVITTLPVATSDWLG